jgi:hypothetical protein
MSAVNQQQPTMTRKFTAAFALSVRQRGGCSLRGRFYRSKSNDVAPKPQNDNFKLLDSKLDIGGAMRKPYNRRKVSLYDSIETLVTARNQIVHAGEIDLGLYDDRLKTTLTDIVEAVDRAYAAIGKHYGFSPIRHF